MSGKQRKDHISRMWLSEVTSNLLKKSDQFAMPID